MAEVVGLLSPPSQGLQPRFGDLAVNMGFATVGQVTAALAQQRQHVFAGKGERWIGKILLDQEVLSAPEVTLVLAELWKRVEGDRARPTPAGPLPGNGPLVGALRGSAGRLSGVA